MTAYQGMQPIVGAYNSGPKAKIKGGSFEIKFRTIMPRRPRINLAEVPQHIVQRDAIAA